MRFGFFLSVAQDMSARRNRRRKVSAVACENGILRNRSVSAPVLWNPRAPSRLVSIGRRLWHVGLICATGAAWIVGCVLAAMAARLHSPQWPVGNAIAMMLSLAGWALFIAALALAFPVLKMGRRALSHRISVIRRAPRADAIRWFVRRRDGSTFDEIWCSA